MSWVSHGLVHAALEAVQDIRQKVVEKGWFGEVTTPTTVYHEHCGYGEGVQTEGAEVPQQAQQAPVGWDMNPNIPTPEQDTPGQTVERFNG